MRSRNLVVQPGGPLRGHIRVPADKSISHRALLLGAIAEGTSLVKNLLLAADCQATLHAVRALGIEVEEQTPTTCIHGKGLHGLQEPMDVLDCGRSGTTMRLLSGLLAGQSFFSVLTGDIQLQQRPMDRVVEPLRRMGATILGRQGDSRPPLAIRGGNLRGIDYSLPVASAQVKSALLLAGLYADDITTLRMAGPARDHTERMLISMGGRLLIAKDKLQIMPVERLQAINITVPGDFSSAAFFIIAATLVPESEITIENVGVNPTRTGLLDVLRTMGGEVMVYNEHTVSGEPVADLVVRASELHGVEIGGELVVRAIDEFPILAVAATQAQGETVVRDAAELRVKESDRIVTTVQELRRLGAEIDPKADGFIVRGPMSLRGAAVHSHGDHRLAMALTVAGLIASGQTIVQDVNCIADSFPQFETVLTKLGGQIL